LVQPLKIEGCPLLYCLRSDLPLLEQLASEESELLPASYLPRLLAPLDPLIYDRKVGRQLWDFDYNWEVYTPAHKRIRGYYALPVLAGMELVGHVDPKADRVARTLQVVSRRIRRGHKVAPAVKELARFLGLRSR
jgi:uncharacterized protein YcaQ